jgi:transposase
LWHDVRISNEEALMHVVMHHDLDELRCLAREEPDPRMVIRLHAIALATEGRTALQVAEELGYSRRGVQFWVKWYNDGGVEPLRNEGGQGRKATLNQTEQKKLKRRLDAGPVPGKDGGVCTLRGVDVRRILKEEFGKIRCLSSVYNLLHAIGYNDLIPRPQHKDADPAAQAAFKKSARS